ncbi:MAG: hypothetical protein AAB296_02075, partial [Candidatus Desantisbacteria bacterium]
SANTKIITATDCTTTVETEGSIITTVFLIQGKVRGLQPLSGPVGDTIVTLTGNGYGHHDTTSEEITIDFGTHYTITTTTSSTNGTFSVTFLISTQAWSTRFITITGNDSAQLQTTSFFITPKIYCVNPGTGTVQSEVIVMGVGFRNYSQVKIEFGSDLGMQALSQSSNNVNGTFSVNFRVNTQPAGTTTITIRDTDTDYPSVFATSTYFIKADIYNLNPTKGPTGYDVTVEGRGYFAWDKVTIHFGNHATITSTIANSNGTFSVTFNESENQPLGLTVITAIGTGTPIQIATIIFEISAIIHYLTPASGAIGTVVTVEGKGYVGTDTIRIDFGTHYTITTTIASTQGTFSTTFIVNTQPWQGWDNEQNLGKMFITATGVNAATATDNTIFKIIPLITCLTPLSGPVGTVITLQGNAWQKQNYIEIMFGTEVSYSGGWATSTINGTFSSTFTINIQSYGTKTITLSQWRDAGIVINLTTSFFITSKITHVSPLLAQVGDSVTVKGNGFGSSTVIQIDFGTHETITTTTTDTNGAFSTV